MNPRILIHSVTLRGIGADEVVRYPFAAGVTVVVGATGTGKTSLLRGIRWNLGGSANWSSAVRGAVQSSDLDLELNGHRFQITRYADRAEIDVLDHSTGALVVRARAAGTRGGADTSMSDFLLDRVGIPKVIVPRARSRARREQTPVSIWDVLDYTFVSQSRMDNSIVYHNNPVRDPKRKATFELLYGLLDEDVAALERRAGELKSELLEARKAVKGIRAFLDGGETPSETALRLEAERLEAVIATATAEAREMRSAARTETPESAGLRVRVLEQEALVSGLLQRQRDASVEVARYEALVAQLDLDLDRLERGEVAEAVLAPFEFTSCPRCSQRVSRSAPEGACMLCLQPEPQAQADGSVQAEHDRLEAQLAETVTLLRDAEAMREQAVDALTAAMLALSELHAELDAHVEGFVSRQYSAIEAAASTLAAATARRSAVEDLIALHDRYRRQSGAVPDLEADLKKVQSDLDAARSEVEAARAKVGRLSEMFDEILRDFRYPWYPADGASIDGHTYLPVVGLDTFAEASSGMQTLLNVAYHLAGLRLGLQDDDTLLPLLLVLDSPRKNIGAISDKSIGQRIYHRFRHLQDSYPDKFQLIAAENDPPPYISEFATINLSYERPLIPWLKHPGEGRVKPIEQ